MKIKFVSERSRKDLSNEWSLSILTGIIEVWHTFEIINVNIIIDNVDLLFWLT